VSQEEGQDATAAPSNALRTDTVRDKTDNYYNKQTLFSVWRVRVTNASISLRMRAINLKKEINPENISN